MEDNALTTISEAIADPVKGKFQGFFRSVKGHYSDTALENHSSKYFGKI